MKSLVLLFSGLLVAFAATAQTNGVKLERATPVKVEKKAVLEGPRGTNFPQKGPIKADGLLVDLARTNRPWRIFDLRTPVDAAKDAANVSTNPVSGRAAGFKLLSIRF